MAYVIYLTMRGVKREPNLSATLLNASSLRFWKTIHDGIDFFFIKCIDKRFREPHLTHSPDTFFFHFSSPGTIKRGTVSQSWGREREREGERERERDDPSRRILSRLLVTFGSTNFGRREETTRIREREREIRRLPQEFRILSFWSFLQREKEKDKERNGTGQNETGWQGSEPFSRISSPPLLFLRLRVRVLVRPTGAWFIFTGTTRHVLPCNTWPCLHFSQLARTRARACHIPSWHRPAVISRCYYFKVTQARC